MYASNVPNSFWTSRNARALPIGLDFQSVADDSGVAEQFLHLLLVIARYFLWIESVKHFAIPRAFPQDCVPAQSRLRPFQYQELKPLVLVMYGHTPFLIMI